MTMTTALLCLALNVYSEARGQPTIGQIMVAQVTMNRAAHDPQRVCGEVRRTGQFAWVADCLDGARVLEACRPREAFAWEHAKKIAKAALAGGFKVLTCADHFHATNMTQRPDWARRMKLVKHVEGHLFYASPRALAGCQV